jgi:glucose-6-phosphate 1-dehydrogenase
MKNAKSITIVIVGATGDLAKNKLIPAVIELVKKDYVTKVDVLAIGRRDLTNKAYANYIGLKDNILESGKLKIHYFKAEFASTDSLKDLPLILKKIEDKSCIGRIFYLATSPEYFKPVAFQISKYCQKKDLFIRIMVEKPFGYNFLSSRTLNKHLHEYFEEDQIYRVDHYLAKETIQNLLVLRFSNPFFERTWNSEFIDKIRIVVSEDMGVESRLEYYDGAGAIRDVLQNHMLQIASFILMDAPMNTIPEEIHKAKADALKKLQFTNRIVIGQYEGYQEELKTAKFKPSNTETYVKLNLEMKDKRWKGTEIILETGKKLAKRFARIDIIYKREPCSIYCDINTNPNKLVLRIQPVQKIEMHMNTKAPGKDLNIKHVKLEFFPNKEFFSNTPESYELILEDCIKGDRTLFLSESELDAAWKLTDQIRKFVKGKKPINYKNKSINLDFDQE